MTTNHQQGFFVKTLYLARILLVIMVVVVPIKVLPITARILVNEAAVRLVRIKMNGVDTTTSSIIYQLELATRLNSNDASAWWNLGLVYDDQDSRQKALQAWQHVPGSQEKLI